MVLPVIEVRDLDFKASENATLPSVNMWFLRAFGRLCCSGRIWSHSREDSSFRVTGCDMLDGLAFGSYNKDAAFGLS